MISKTLKFENLAGEVVTREFFFHLSKQALIRMNFSEKGGLEKQFKKYIDEGDDAKILETFEMIISKAYGMPHEDGEQFIQSKELSEAFMNTDAYSTLMIELMSGATSAAEFVVGVLPASMREAAGSGNVTELKDVTGETIELYKPPSPANPTVPTPELSPLGLKPEPLEEITTADLLAAVRDGKLTLGDAATLSPEELARKIKG